MEPVQIELTPGMRVRALSPNGGPSHMAVLKARKQDGFFNPPTVVRLGRVRGNAYRPARLSKAIEVELYQRYGTMDHTHLLSRGVAAQDDRGNVNVTMRPACVWWRENGRTYEVEVPGVVEVQD